MINPGDRVTYMPNPSSHCNHNHLSYFRFVGRIIAKAIFDNKYLDCHFTRFFYKHILGVPVQWVYSYFLTHLSSSTISVELYESWIFLFLCVWDFYLQTSTCIFLRNFICRQYALLYQLHVHIYIKAFGHGITRHRLLPKSVLLDGKRCWWFRRKFQHWRECFLCYLSKLVILPCFNISVILPRFNIYTWFFHVFSPTISSHDNLDVLLEYYLYYFKWLYPTHIRQCINDTDIK